MKRLRFPARCLLALVLAFTGCAQPYLSDASLRGRGDALPSQLLAPPMLTVYEQAFTERAFPKEAWSREASETVQRAFLDEAAARGLAVEAIEGAPREADDMADLFAMVDLSLRRHAWRSSPEAFAPNLSGYSLGPAVEWPQGQKADAVWWIGGANLIPTTGTAAAETVGCMLALAATAFLAPIPPPIVPKVELRAALADRTGAILFYCVIGPGDLSAAEEPFTGGNAPRGSTPSQDLRNPATARLAARAILERYRKAVTP